jgi:hypothetical protein
MTMTTMIMMRHQIEGSAVDVAAADAEIIVATAIPPWTVAISP